MFGILRKSIVIGTAGLITSYGIAQFPTSVVENTITAPSKYVSMMSRIKNNGYELNENDREELDETLLYLFQSKIFESPYHSLYLCYPQTSSVFLDNVGFGNMGSLVFDNTNFYLTCLGFLIACNNMQAMFIAN